MKNLIVLAALFLIPASGFTHELSCAQNAQLKMEINRAEIAMKTSIANLQMTEIDAEEAAITNQKSLGLMAASFASGMLGLFAQAGTGVIADLVATSDAAGNIYASSTLLYPLISLVANGLNMDNTLAHNTAEGIALSSATEANGNLDLAISIVQEKRGQIDRDRSRIWNGLTAGASQHNMMRSISEHVKAELILRKTKLETLKAICNHLDRSKNPHSVSAEPTLNDSISRVD